MPGVHDQDQPPSAPCFEGDFFGQDYSEHDFGREPGGYQHPTDNNDDEIQDVEIQDDGIQDDEIQDDHLDFDPNEPDWEPEVDEQYQGPPLHDEEHLPSESDNVRRTQAERTENERNISQEPYRSCFRRAKEIPVPR
ncbi:hypothetical protein QCA50_019090 [Cerrena zonata]